MFVRLKQFLSLFLCVAIHVLARMTKQVWKVIGAVELLSDGHKKNSLSEQALTPGGKLS